MTKVGLDGQIMCNGVNNAWVSVQALFGYNYISEMKASLEGVCVCVRERERESEKERVREKGL